MSRADSWPAQNVRQWVCNDEGLIQIARVALRRNRNCKDAAQWMLNYLQTLNVTETPDGAKYTVSSLAAALACL